MWNFRIFPAFLSLKSLREFSHSCLLTYSMLYTIYHKGILLFYLIIFINIIASTSLLKIQIIKKSIDLYMKTAQKEPNCILGFPTELEIASLH